MNDNSLAFAGIDISKDTFDIAVRKPQTFKLINAKMPNNYNGFRQLVRWLSRYSLRVEHLIVVMEATGGYELKLATWLFKAKARVHVLNGFIVKKFAESLLSHNKTDEVDAAVMCQLAIERGYKLRCWRPATKTERESKALRRRIKQLDKMLHQENCRLKGPALEQLELDSIKRLRQHLEAEREELERQIEQLMARDAKLAHQRELLMSIPCVGPVVSSNFLISIGDIERFSSARQVCAYLAVAPRRHQSGTSVKKPSRMIQWGHKEFKSKLFRPAQTAKTHNPVVRKFVERLKANDPQKSKDSLTGAAMHKMVCLMYGVLKSGRPFDPSLHGCT